MLRRALTALAVAAAVVGTAVPAQAAARVSVRPVTTTVTSACATYALPTTVRPGAGVRWRLDVTAWGDDAATVQDATATATGTGTRRPTVRLHVCAQAGEHVTGRYTVQSTLTLVDSRGASDGAGTDGSGHPQFVAVSALTIKAAPTRLTMQLSKKATTAGQAFTASGTATKTLFTGRRRTGLDGERLGVQFKPSGSSVWTTIGHVRAGSGGAWSARVTLVQSGSLRVAVDATKVHDGKRSGAQRVSVSR
ncbi:hypothetical protein [Angustibacter aerolatus]